MSNLKEKKMANNFKSFCTRMWLDHCDENSAFGAIALDKEEYIKTYNEWLLQKYAEQVEERNDI